MKMIEVREDEEITVMQIIENEAQKLNALATAVESFIETMRFEKNSHCELLYMLIEGVQEFNDMV